MRAGVGLGGFVGGVRMVSGEGDRFLLVVGFGGGEADFRDCHFGS